MPDRYLVISADTHAVAPKSEFRPYVEARDREAFEEEVRQEACERALVREWSRQFFADGDEASEDERYLRWNRAAEDAEANRVWEPARWLAMTEADGVVASVVYPGGSLSRPPFEGMLTNLSPELRSAGQQIYNRWLAEFCAEIPERVAGVAQLPEIDDVDNAVTTVEWAANAGLRGGVLLPPTDDDRPGYHDRSYDRLWAACQDHDMPVNCHGPAGNVKPNPTLYGDDAVGQAIEFHDAKPAYRALWFFILGGVLERFPRLKLCFTEQLAKWVPYELKRLDDVYFDTSFSATSRVGAARDAMSLSPSEYWRRNCAVGATFMSRPEAVARHDIGIDTIMWGTDFPHPEGTYPVTRESLRYSFARVPSEDLVRMLGENAARIYNFDLDALAPIAARVGPPVQDVIVELDEPPVAYRDKHAFRPN